MVRIENIIWGEDVISMDCYEEGKKERHIALVLDANTFQIISPAMEILNFYIGQAIAKIRRVKNEKPTSLIVACY